MEVTPINKPDDRARIVVPDLRPPADPPGWRRVYTGIACLLLRVFVRVEWVFFLEHAIEMAMAVFGCCRFIVYLSIVTISNECAEYPAGNRVKFLDLLPFCIWLQIFKQAR